MYKKNIFNLLIFLMPISIIGQDKKDKSTRIINYEFNMLENNNLHQKDNLFEANEEKNILVKNCWEEELLSKKNIAHLAKIFFYNFVRDEY